jgi:hypothetical protein
LFEASVLELCPSCWHFCFIGLFNSGWHASVPGFIVPASFLANDKGEPS